MKAYMAFVGDGPYDEGCLLVFAKNATAARYCAYKNSLWGDSYIEHKVRRVKFYDGFAEGNCPYCIESNSDLPDGAKPFYDNSKF